MQLVKILPSDQRPSLLYRENWNLSNLDDIKNLNLTQHDRIVLAHGCFKPNQIYHELPEDEILETMKVNLLSTVKIIEMALNVNPHVRICVVGSESGLKGSKNIAYGLAKTALHKYVEERKVGQNQQLVCVAPSLIEDSKITEERRKLEPEVVEAAIANHPKKRGVFGREIANMIYYLLYGDEGYTTNTVIHINGGKYARS